MGSVCGNNGQLLEIEVVFGKGIPASNWGAQLLRSFMKIKFFGVRGSYPVPGPDTVRYGGNTTCVSISKEVNNQICRIIIDCGTGIVRLGQEIISNYFVRKESLDQTILFTHLHPDHTQGFPFFAPNFFPSNLDLYGMNALRMGIEEVLRRQ